MLVAIDVRYDVAWYATPGFSIVSATLVLLVLLSESLTLHAQLAISVLAQRRLFKLDPFVSIDARITKGIRLDSSRRLDLFFEGFNLTNHENLTPYSVNVNIISSSFLVRNGARPPRQFQWGARFTF